MKSIRNLSEFARQNNISPQLAKQKRDNGYVFGILDGKHVIYNPKSVMFLNGYYKNDNDNYLVSGELRTDMHDFTALNCAFDSAKSTINEKFSIGDKNDDN
jgi:hypothetical protein